jgi:hypothetical protein
MESMRSTEKIKIIIIYFFVLNVMSDQISDGGCTDLGTVTGVTGP